MPIYKSTGARPFAGALIKGTTTISLNTGAGMVITWTSTVYNTGGFYSSATQPTRLVVPTGVSRARVQASLELDTFDTKNFSMIILKNGTDAIGMGYEGTSTEYGHTNLQCMTAVVSVVAGDYFTCQAQQNAGGAHNIIPGFWTWFFIEAIS